MSPGSSHWVCPEHTPHLRLQGPFLTCGPPHRVGLPASGLSRPRPEQPFQERSISEPTAICLGDSCLGDQARPVCWKPCQGYDMAVCRHLTARGLTGLADVGWALSVVCLRLGRKGLTKPGLPWLSPMGGDARAAFGRRTRNKLREGAWRAGVRVEPRGGAAERARAERRQEGTRLLWPRTEFEQEARELGVGQSQRFR